MSKLMLTITAGGRSVHRAVHSGVVEVVVAALSAEPETIEELEASVTRFFEPPNGGSFFDGWVPGLCDTPRRSGLCVIDLGARLVVNTSRRSPPGRSGRVAYRDGDAGCNVWLTYHVSDDWEFCDREEGWKSLAKQRRQRRESSPPLDARSVLYGRLPEFIATQCLAVAAATPRPEDVVADIHARWLMTPREDLQNRPPRDVLLAKRDSVDRDLEDRCGQWSKLGKCPPGLGRDYAAFRFGGFGTHEIVLYYELVRELLAGCWKRAQEDSKRDLSDETAHLQKAQETWLATPQADLEGYCPAELIERERLRLPLVLTGENAVLDHDCPLCRMMAEDDGPVFWHLDGCHMDDDFPFSFYPNRPEWELDHADWDRFRRAAEAAPVGRETTEERGNKASGETTAVWAGSCVSEECENTASPLLRVFGIGVRLCEVITDLKQSPRTETSLIATLNRDFDNLRETVGNANDSLVEPVVSRLGQDLDDVAIAHPELSEKCAALQQQLIGLTQCVGRELNGAP